LAKRGLFCDGLAETKDAIIATKTNLTNILNCLLIPLNWLEPSRNFEII
jgi:hypothetical protein